MFCFDEMSIQKDIAHLRNSELMVKTKWHFLNRKVTSNFHSTENLILFVSCGANTGMPLEVWKKASANIFGKLTEAHRFWK